MEHSKLIVELLPLPFLDLNSHSVKALGDVELQTDYHLLMNRNDHIDKKSQSSHGPH